MLKLLLKEKNSVNYKVVSMLSATDVYTTEQKRNYIAILTIKGISLGGGINSPRRKNSYCRKKAANKTRMDIEY